jgi:diguanylate cyclase (GGDEF)-like protein
MSPQPPEQDDDGAPSDTGERRRSGDAKPNGAPAYRAGSHAGRGLTDAADPGALAHLHDLDAAVAELRNTYFDLVTGVFGHELGTAALEREVSRAHRGHSRLVLALVNVDDLDNVIAHSGNVAADALLRDVADAMRRSFRSYDPIVRLATGEFLCAVSSCDIRAARQRFRDIQEGIATRRPGVTISIGLAVLGGHDTLADLVARSDRDLRGVEALSD